METYDCAIIGGGVSGLALSIQLSRAGKNVILFEKEEYPFHKVCGEYISNESLPFLASLGLNLKTQDLPQIKNILLSAPSGTSFTMPLAIGGTGLSRFELDNRLCKLAKETGVNVQSSTKVTKIVFENDSFALEAGEMSIRSKTLCGAYGKNSNIDAQLGLSYRATSNHQLFIAVKYHLRADFDPATVQMHNFPGGYCGMSAIEDGQVNMSYVSKVSNLKLHKTIPEMEKHVLSQNPHLKKFFTSAQFLYEKPLTISHLQFGIKHPVFDHLLMLGDSAGNIAPLSGNGMSIALRSSKIASVQLLAFLDGKQSREKMEENYLAEYKNAFASRIRMARYVHRFFGKTILTESGFRILRAFPQLAAAMSERLHGEAF